MKTNTLKFRGQEVEVEICFEREPENSFIQAAWWVEHGEPLGDDSLDELNVELADYVHEQWLEHQISRAEYLADLASDR